MIHYWNLLLLLSLEPREDLAFLLLVFLVFPALLEVLASQLVLARLARQDFRLNRLSLEVRLHRLILASQDFLENLHYLVVLAILDFLVILARLFDLVVLVILVLLDCLVCLVFLGCPATLVIPVIPVILVCLAAPCRL